MNRLVGNLLDLTRFSEGRIELRHDWVAIDELIGAVLARLKDLLASHPVTLHLPPDPPLVQGDEVMLEQVLSNLIENVARHTPAGTPFEVYARADDDVLEVAVRDHGPGFPPGEETRVFEKFHQARPESAQSGFGLGLAISQGDRRSARRHDHGAERIRRRRRVPLHAAVAVREPALQ